MINTLRHRTIFSRVVPSPSIKPRKCTPSVYLAAYLQFGLGDVDFPFVDELDDEFEVGVANVLGHDYGGVLAGIL